MIIFPSYLQPYMYMTMYGAFDVRLGIEKKEGQEHERVVHILVNSYLFYAMLVYRPTCIDTIVA